MKTHLNIHRRHEKKNDVVSVSNPQNQEVQVKENLNNIQTLPENISNVIPIENVKDTNTSDNLLLMNQNILLIKLIQEYRYFNYNHNSNVNFNNNISGLLNQPNLMPLVHLMHNPELASLLNLILINQTPSNEQARVNLNFLLSILQNALDSGKKK